MDRMTRTISRRAKTKNRKVTEQNAAMLKRPRRILRGLLRPREEWNTLVNCQMQVVPPSSILAATTNTRTYSHLQSLRYPRQIAFLNKKFVGGLPSTLREDLARSWRLQDYIAFETSDAFQEFLCFITSPGEMNLPFALKAMDSDQDTVEVPGCHTFLDLNASFRTERPIRISHRVDNYRQLRRGKRYHCLMVHHTVLLVHDPCRIGSTMLLSRLLRGQESRFLVPKPSRRESS